MAKTTTSRRSALAMLGIVPAAGSALAIENFITDPEYPGEFRSGAGAHQVDRFAKALENLAAELRAGHLSITSLALAAKVEANDVVDQHELVVKFLYHPES